MTPTRTAGPGWLLTWQVAELLLVSPKTVSRWAKEGKLPYRETLGKHRRYPEAKIRALVAELEVESRGDMNGETRSQ